MRLIIESQKENSAEILSLFSVFTKSLFLDKDFVWKYYVVLFGKNVIFIYVAGVESLSTNRK